MDAIKTKIERDLDLIIANKPIKNDAQPKNHARTRGIAREGVLKNVSPPLISKIAIVAKTIIADRIATRIQINDHLPSLVFGKKQSFIKRILLP